jgi:hypothetical protein
MLTPVLLPPPGLLHHPALLLTQLLQPWQPHVCGCLLPLDQAVRCMPARSPVRCQSNGYENVRWCRSSAKHRQNPLLVAGTWPDTLHACAGQGDVMTMTLNQGWMYLPARTGHRRTSTLSLTSTALRTEVAAVSSPCAWFLAVAWAVESCDAIACRVDAQMHNCC